MALELSQRYEDILKTGKFQSLVCPDPWPHYVLDDLIQPTDFKDIQNRIIAREMSFRQVDDHPAKIRQCYVEEMDLAAFFFSKKIKSLFEGIAGCHLRPNEELAIQFRQMTPDSPEFPIHIDLVDQPSLIALYYVAPGWAVGRGGEILLLKSETSDDRDPSTKWVAPKENRLLLFLSHEDHWHSVKRVKNWNRLMVLTEWLKV